MTLRSSHDRDDPTPVPDTTPAATVVLVLDLRRRLAAQGLDAGADTIGWHLEHHHQLLAHSAEGQRWLPSFGERAEDHWGDGIPAVDLIHRIAAGSADRLAGRVIHVGDDLEALTKSCSADPNERRLRLRR